MSLELSNVNLKKKHTVNIIIDCYNVDVNDFVEIYALNTSAVPLAGIGVMFT